MTDSNNMYGANLKEYALDVLHNWINPKLKMKAAVHEMRAIDLIGHLCFTPGLDHLINDEQVNELFRWRAPIYIEDELELFQSK